MITDVKKLTFSSQAELIRYCIASEINLEAELGKIGMSYDSLCYRQSSPDLSLFSTEGLLRPYQSLDDFQPFAQNIPVVSFFSGAGGLDLGFERAGFKHLASIEINSLFCETLRKNRSRWTVLGPPLHSGDICNKDEYSHLFRQKLGITTPFEGVFHGGPPCQSFSIAANQRFSKSGENFKRTGFAHEKYGNLLFEYVWYIKEFLPRAFLIENVAGLLEIDGGDQLAIAIASLRESGYEVTTPRVLNAADYGVPQNRMRVFICGTRASKSISLPEKEQGRVPCMKAFEEPLQKLKNHITREHKADSILRYMELNYGQRDHLGRVDRLDPKLASKTIIAGGVNGGGRSHLHPEIPRTLSVRECARLQTFPDEYEFCGPSARQFTQVGNAVPPVLAFKLAREIYNAVYR